MIYALTKHDTSRSEREKIAQAIKDGNQAVIQLIEKGTIIHIMDLKPNSTDLYYCIFCCNAIFPTDARSPLGLQAQRTWHFQHKGTGYAPGKCVGHARHPQIPYALDINNPAKHGCYICLGCETDNGDRHRQKCKTIVKGQTYCHLAEQYKCTGS